MCSGVPSGENGGSFVRVASGWKFRNVRVTAVERIDEKGKPRRAGTFVRVMPKTLNVPPRAFYSGADRMG